MTEVCPSLALYDSKIGAEWIKQLESISAGSSKPEHPEHVRPLPREDLAVFGVYPKYDHRVLLMCNKCSKLVLPIAFMNHLKYYHSSKNQVTNPNTEKENKIRAKKKRNNAKLPPLFPIQILPAVFESLQIEVETATGETGDDQQPPEGKEEKGGNLKEAELREILTAVKLDDSFGSQEFY